MLTDELSVVTSSPIMPISGVSGAGVTELLRALLDNVELVRGSELAQEKNLALDENEEMGTSEDWSPI